MAAILAFVAGQGNIALGVILLAIYAIGHCALILIAGTSVGFVQKLADNPHTERLGKGLKIIFGHIGIKSCYVFILHWVLNNKTAMKGLV